MNFINLNIYLNKFYKYFNTMMKTIYEMILNHFLKKYFPMWLNFLSIKQLKMSTF